MVKSLGVKMLLTLALMIPALGCITPSVERMDVRITVSQDPAYAPYKLLNEVALPTYKVLAPSWSGSSVAINENTLITAAHVVVDETGSPLPSVLIHRSLGNDLATEATVEFFNIKQDLAVLRTKTKLDVWAKMLPYTQISNRVTWMALVVACGNSLGTDDAHVTFGHITSLNDDGMIRYSALTMPGNSGGPVFVLSGNVWHVASISQAGYVAGAPIAHMGLGCNPFTLNLFVRLTDEE